MWFSTKILFKSKVANPSDRKVLFEESIKLFCADNRKEAEQKALALGKKHAVSYKNENGEAVTWSFIKVIEIQSISEESISDGIEVFSYLYYD